MKKGKLLVHILGLFLFIVFLSINRDTLLVSLAMISLLSVSVSQHLEKTNLSLPGISFISLLLPFCIPTITLGDLYILFYYLLIVAFPLVMYWYVVLAERSYFDKMAFPTAVSYFALVLIVFYLMLAITGIQDYIFGYENQGPQALLLSGCAVLVFLAYGIKLPKT